MTQSYYQLNFIQRENFGFLVQSEELDSRIGPVFEELGLIKTEPPEKGIVIEVEMAGPLVRSQLSSAISNKYGEETITPRPDGRKVYRYKGIALFIHSYTESYGRIGITENFLLEHSSKQRSIVLARAISWALAPLGVVGLWGGLVDHGIAVSKRPQSGQFVLVDAVEKIIYFKGKTLSLQKHGDFLFSSNGLRESEVRRTRKEELISRLASCMCFFGLVGPPRPLLQGLQSLAYSQEGIVVGPRARKSVEIS